jgi:hypothetical protein
MEEIRYRYLAYITVAILGPKPVYTDIVIIIIIIIQIT